MKTAFLNCQLLTGDGQFYEQANVIVEKEKITQIILKKEDIPADAHCIALNGLTLMPGLIDCHVHLCLDGSTDPVHFFLNESCTDTVLKAAAFARQTLLAGITTVRDLGGKAQISIELKNAVNNQLIEGPRIVTSGQIICMTGGHGNWMGVEADGEDELIKAARRQIQLGADWIKLMATGGIMTKGVKPGQEQLSERELRAAIEASHNAGIKTSSHAQGTKGIINALRAGIDSIEHGIYLSDEAVALLLEKNAFLVPTLSATYHLVQGAIKRVIPEFMTEKVMHSNQYHSESIRLAQKAGVKIAMGTDAGTPLNQHGQNLWELKLLSQAGFSAHQVIQAATKNAAELLGMQDKLGTIEEGKTADLIVVRGNPLEQIDLLLEPENIKIIMKEGKIVKNNLTD